MCCFDSWAGEKLFEVRHMSMLGDKFVVNLDEHDCTCRKWTIIGLPCCRSISAMRFLNLNVDQVIPHWFRRSTYEETYTPIIYPVNGPNVWEMNTNIEVMPPAKRILPGRPKKKRRLESWELRKDDMRVRQGGTQKRCAICRQLGHKKNSCPQAPEPDESATQEQTQPHNDSATEAPEAPTQPPTEAPAEAPAEAPTQPLTQAPPEALTQAPPEPPTQPPVDATQPPNETNPQPTNHQVQQTHPRRQLAKTLGRKKLPFRRGVAWKP